MYVVCMKIDSDMELIDLDEPYRCYEIETGKCTARYGRDIIKNTDTYRSITKVSDRFYITRDLSDAFTDTDKPYIVKGVLSLYTVYYVNKGLFISLDVPHTDLVYRRKGDTLEASDMVIRQGLPRWIPCGDSIVYVRDYGQVELKLLTIWDFEAIIKDNIKRL